MDHHIRPVPLAALVIAALCSIVASPTDASDADMYRVTLENLTSGQPLSPPVAATHRPNHVLFEVGQPVSAEAELLAENGDQQPLVQLLLGLHGVNEVVDFGAPLVPAGSSAGGFTDRATVDIQARGGDRLSLVTMLVCTNDGLSGVDRIKLPKGGDTYRLLGFDAGSEDNTELSGDLPDPCSALGPVVLAGDPNGNENVAVDSVPHQPVALHPGIALVGDLGAQHAWTGPVARLTVVGLGDERSRQFSTDLSGFAEAPPADSDAHGEARLKLEGNHRLKVKLKIKDLYGFTAAHIHLGDPGVNGPIVATLYPTDDCDNPGNGNCESQGWRHGADRGDDDCDDDSGDCDDDEIEIEITLDESNLDGGPFAGDFPAFVSALRTGALYVNAHTTTYPGGEVRGQIGARD